jgi:conjugal transfer pilus assembly protein TraB
VAEEKSAGTGASRLGLSLKAKTGVFAVPGKKNVGRRWWYVLGAGVLFLIVVITSVSKKPSLPPPAKQEAPAINLTPSGLAEQSWEAQSQTQIQSLKDQSASLQATVASLKTELSQLQQQLTAAHSAVPAGPAAGAELPPPPPPPPPLPPSPTASGTSLTPSKGEATPAPPLEEGSGTESAPTGPYVFSPKPVPAEKATSAPAAAPPQANIHKVPVGSGTLLTGAFVKVVLLNGLDAGTSSQTQSNPEPVLLRVQDNAVLPGSAQFHLRSCFMLGAGYGSLSSERVYIRLSQLSCVDKNQTLVLSEPVRGYVVDSDSMLGLRGKLIDRQGARIGKALLAGFAEGLANAFGGAQGVMTTSAIGTESTITGSAAVRAAGLTGAATASSQLAQFYLQQAESIFPVISVRGGRLATAVFTTSVPLEWGQVQGVTDKSSGSTG